MKTFEIINIGTKYAINYYDSNVLELSEFHSVDGINGTVRDGYIEKKQAQLISDKYFGIKLINEFLIDNRESPIAFNPQLSMSVMQKFSAVKALSEVGDIKSVNVMLPLIEIDNLFTQERKDKYILMCQNYLASWG